MLQKRKQNYSNNRFLQRSLWKKGNFQLLDKKKEFSQKVGVNFLIFITMVHKNKSLSKQLLSPPNKLNMQTNKYLVSYLE